MGADIGPERISAMALRAVAKFSPGRPDVYRCVCRDTGFIEEEGTPLCVIPCSRCNRETYDRWMDGQYRANDGGPRREQSPDAAERRAERERFGSRR